MGFKFYRKIFLVCFFLNLSSCGKGGEGVSSSVSGKEGDKKASPEPALDVTATALDTKGTPEPESESISPSGKSEPPKTLLSDSDTKLAKSEQPEALSFNKINIYNRELSKVFSKQIAQSGLLEGQSDVFAYYIHFWIDLVDSYIKAERTRGRIDQTVEKVFKVLCSDPSKCEKGLNLENVDKSVISDLISVLSNFPRSTTIDGGKKKEPSIIFIQSYLFVPGSLFMRQRRNESSGEEPIYMRAVKNIAKDIIDHNIKDIVINFPVFPQQPGMDYLPFFYLGEVIRKQEMDLHIVGNCGTYCFNYLLPAAKTVYVESFYGHVSTKGSFKALRDSVIRNREPTRFVEEWKAEFEKNTTSEEVKKNLQVQIFQELIRFIILVKSSHSVAQAAELIGPGGRIDVSKAIVRFFSDDLYGKGTGNKILSEMVKFVNGSDKQTLVNLTEEDLAHFVTGLPPELSDKIYAGLSVFKEIIVNNYYNSLNSSTAEESDYYDKIEIEGLRSKKSYTFLDFLYISALFSRRSFYEQEFFSLKRAYYTVLEEEKPYWVAPSLNLLRELGLDVRGEKNNIERLFDFFEDKGDSEEKLLYLDSTRIENCDFFNDTASFDKGTLDKCLSL